MEMQDKILLRKRSVIETVNDELKNICQIEHSRHLSFYNFKQIFLQQKQLIFTFQRNLQLDSITASESYYRKFISQTQVSKYWFKQKRNNSTN